MHHRTQPVAEDDDSNAALLRTKAKACEERAHAMLDEVPTEDLSQAYQKLRCAHNWRHSYGFVFRLVFLEALNKYVLFCQTDRNSTRSGWYAFAATSVL